MGTVSIRDLARNASRVVSDVATSRRPALVTSHGRPVAAVVPIDEEALEDWILANAPEFAAGMQEAEDDYAAGTTRPAADVFAELEEPAG